MAAVGTTVGVESGGGKRMLLEDPEDECELHALAAMSDVPLLAICASVVVWEVERVSGLECLEGGVDGFDGFGGFL